MADEYISKRLFNDAIREAVRRYPNTFYNGLETARQIAHDLPSADVAPVRHGRWELDVLDGTPGYRPVCIVCSECHRVNYGSTPYCPNCGAKMDGGDSDER